MNIGIGYTNIPNNSVNPLLRSTMGFVFGANTGYNYKIKNRWLVGGRVYYNYNVYNISPDDSPCSVIMGLISLGYKF